MPEEIKALYVDFVIRCKYKEGSFEFDEALKKDPYFNALQVKFGYAITCHKAQGGEWSKVFVDFDGRDKTSNDELRWSYTAITRASKQLYVINKPDTEQLQFKKISMPIQELTNIPSKTIQVIESGATRFHSLDTPNYLRAKYFEIEQRIESIRGKIVRVESRDYLEMYYLEVDGQQFRYDINYKKSGVFSPGRITGNHPNIAKILPLLNASGSTYAQVQIVSDHELVQKVYNKLLEHIKKTSCYIIGSDLDHLDSYFFTFYIMGDDVCSLKFFFNNKQQISGVHAFAKQPVQDSKFNLLITAISKL